MGDTALPVVETFVNFDLHALRLKKLKGSPYWNPSWILFTSHVKSSKGFNTPVAVWIYALATKNASVVRPDDHREEEIKRRRSRGGGEL